MEKSRILDKVLILIFPCNLKHVLFILTVLLAASSCSNRKKEKQWVWDEQIYTPMLLRDNDTINYMMDANDTFKTGEHFRARLFRQFRNIPDSSGADMIKEFKGYYFRLLMNNDLNPNHARSWTAMNTYMRQVGDTVFIDIPIDSVIKYADKKIRWQAGYRHIFHKNNADTSYTIGGTWVLIDSSKHVQANPRR